jgi:hypothetical protein
MAAGTALQVIDRPTGHHFSGNFNLAPGNIASGAREVETVAVPGAQIGDVVYVNSRTQLLAGLIVADCRVASAGNIEIYLENNAPGAVQQPAGIWDFVILRGSTIALR